MGWGSQFLTVKLSEQHAQLARFWRQKDGVAVTNHLTFSTFFRVSGNSWITAPAEKLWQVGGLFDFEGSRRVCLAPLPPWRYHTVTCTFIGSQFYVWDTKHHARVNFNLNGEKMAVMLKVCWNRLHSSMWRCNFRRYCTIFHFDYNSSK